MVQQLRELGVPAEDSGSTPSTRVRLLTITSNSSSKESAVSFWPPWATNTHICKPTHKQCPLKALFGATMVAHTSNHQYSEGLSSRLHEATWIDSVSNTPPHPTPAPKSLFSKLLPFAAEAVEGLEHNDVHRR
jgi:hypothetical protein